ncbi:MAG: hypothetical protein ABSC88_11115 [Terracidiphilus sp.]|jgi:hypothetical protein
MICVFNMNVMWGLKMNQTSRRILGILCGTALLCVSSGAQEKRYSSDTSDEILPILRSKDESALTEAFNRSKKLYTDRVAQAFQKYRLNRSSENELFAILPASAEQIRELYQLTVLNPTTGHEELVALYEGYYNAVFKAAPNHPESFPILISIAENYGEKLSEGESPWFCDLLHELYESAPDLYLKTLVSHRNLRHMALVCAAGCEDTKE